MSKALTITVFEAPKSRPAVVRRLTGVQILATGGFAPEDVVTNEQLAEHGYDPAMGARPMARVIQENIKKPLADEILFGKLAKGGEVNVTEKDGELVLSFDGDEVA